MQLGLTGTNAGLEQGGSATVATTAMMAQGDRARQREFLLGFTAGG